MVNVDSGYHSAILSQSPKTRVRIYMIDNTVDCTDDADVTANGTLIKRDNSDTDSSTRIAEGGITFTEYFCKDENWEIGCATSNAVAFNLMNDDGQVRQYLPGRCKIYLDVYYSNAWHSCPMGVYYLDTPRRRNAYLDIVGSDAMSKLDVFADDWWNNIDFSGGITISTLLSQFATQVGVKLKPNMTILNGGFSYDNAPFVASNITYREILSQIACVAGANARFDRDGYLELKWFTDSPSAYNTVPSCYTVDLADYCVEPIDLLTVRATETDIGVTVGSGTNNYTITNCPFLYLDELSLGTRATNIYNRISAMSIANLYPATISLQADPAFEAGDSIRFPYKAPGHPYASNYEIYIFQQEIIWNGGAVSGTISCTGDEYRTLPPEDNGMTEAEFRARKALHELEKTVEILRSRIQDTEGNYSELVQTVSEITQTVGNLDSSVTSILDPSGQMWTFMNRLQNDINSTNSTVSENKSDADDAFDNISTYIRFIGGNIVLGKSDADIKLKIMRDAMMFYSGSDDETNLDNAIAYFTFSEFYDAIVKSSNYVQIGSAGDGTDWQWVKRDNGHITLWRV